MLGIVSDELFESAIQSSHSGQSCQSVQSNPKIIQHNPRGRSNGDVNVPTSLRKIIGEEKIVNGRTSAISLAENFGVSHDSTDAYGKGTTSLADYNNPNRELKTHLDKVRETITKRASSKLLSALESITQDKLENTKASEAAGIAKDMSVIIKNIEPQTEDNNPRIGPNFVFFAPRQKQESDFDVINANE